MAAWDGAEIVELGAKQISTGVGSTTTGALQLGVTGEVAVVAVVEVEVAMAGVVGLLHTRA